MEELNELRQRLDRLERENRRLKIAGAILVFGLAALGSMGPAPEGGTQGG